MVKSDGGGRKAYISICSSIQVLYLVSEALITFEWTVKQHVAPC